jgi:hypothetical protein
MVKRYEKIWCDGEGYLHAIKIKYKKRAGFITDQRYYDFFDRDSVTAFMYNVANSILAENIEDKEKRRLAFSISKRYFKKSETEKNKILKRSYERVARFFWRLCNTHSDEWMDIIGD